MKRTIISALFIFFLLIILACQDKKSIAAIEINQSKINTDTRLKDGINISNSLVEDIEFNKYKYENDYIENIKLSSLENFSYRVKFLKYLAERSFDQGQYEQVYFVKLLLTRIQQTNDTQLYLLLSSVFNDKNLGYYLEDYELDLFQLFLYKPVFFISGSYVYKQDQLVNYINQNLPPALLTNKKVFEDNVVDMKFDQISLLLSEETFNTFRLKPLVKEIKEKTPYEEAFFSPSYGTEWKNKTIRYYNILNYLNQKIQNNLDEEELKYYDKTFNPIFKSYIIQSENLTYSIQDPDGYTNLRKGKNTTSEVLQKIKSGDGIEVVDNTGDWYLIKTKEGKTGYVHKSRVKSD